MPILAFLFALLIAVALALVLVYPFGRRGPGPLDGLLVFFVILFLAVWAGGLWIRPVGPLVWGIPWLTLVVVGVIVALLLAASAGPRDRRRRSDEPAEEANETTETTVIAISAFFYAAVLAMSIAIVLSFVL